MFGWLRRLFGSMPRGKASPDVPARRSEYDAARTTDEGRRHWALTDGLSARSANSPEVRRTLRERARYESANNSYCRGMVLTRANDLIGTGPRLAILGDDRAMARAVELRFAAWACATRLAEKLRTMAQAKPVDGEAFAVLGNNDLLDDPVRLDVQLIETDRVTDPYPSALTRDLIDGVKYDASGNPVYYTILREHPGDNLRFSVESDRVPARSVLHWFRCDRPGQVRGASELTPALPLFAQLRRYTLAVLAAAETAADFAAVLETPAPDDVDADEEAVDTTLSFEIERRMMVRLPDGTQLKQLEAEQPTTTYGDFKRQVLSEAARCLDMPWNKAAGDSSSYNYASGRLDHQTYHRSLSVERSHLEHVVLDRVFRAWLDEAVMIPGYLPDGIDVEAINWRWFWDGWEHVDPLKEASAAQTLLANHLTTLADHYAARGQDWVDALTQRAAELRLMDELGIPQPMQPGSPQQQQQQKEETGSEKEEANAA